MSQGPEGTLHSFRGAPSRPFSPAYTSPLLGALCIPSRRSSCTGKLVLAKAASFKESLPLRQQPARQASMKRFRFVAPTAESEPLIHSSVTAAWCAFSRIQPRFRRSTIMSTAALMGAGSFIPITSAPFTTDGPPTKSNG